MTMPSSGALAVRQQVLEATLPHERPALAGLELTLVAPLDEDRRSCRSTRGSSSRPGFGSLSGETLSGPEPGLMRA
jgi:hypothetical protein